MFSLLFHILFFFKTFLQQKKRHTNQTKKETKQNQKNRPGTNSWIVVCPWLCGNPWFSPQRRKPNPRYDHVHRQPPSSQRSWGVTTLGIREFNAGKNQRVTFGICWCGLDVVRGVCEKNMFLKQWTWKNCCERCWIKTNRDMSKHLNYIEITLTAWKRMAWPLPQTRRWENSLMVLWRWSHFACMLELLSRVREIQRRELMVHFQGIFTDHFKLTRKADSYGNC